MVCRWPYPREPSIDSSFTSNMKVSLRLGDEIFTHPYPYGVNRQIKGVMKSSAADNGRAIRDELQLVPGPIRQKVRYISGMLAQHHRTGKLRGQCSAQAMACHKDIVGGRLLGCLDSL